MMTLENRSAMKSVPTKSACLPRQTLKEYLSGWTAEDQTLQIEQHLADCSDCEQTVQELEAEPDTLLESLRDDPAAESNGQAIAEGAVEDDEPMAKAVQRAKLLMDEADEPAWKSWQPSAGDLGAYELLRPLAQGGMGAVYLARHRQLGKTVAVKLLPAPSAENQDALLRFQREVRAAGRLDHSAIVTATDAGTHQGTHYLVMEFVSGMDLSHLARHLGKLPVSEACELARQTALGLSHAHAEGIVHRDIKPSNLMLDETGHVKILDFGLAQLSFWDEAAVELTTVGQLMGTLDYMAPEQAERCGSVDYRVDLYGLGAMLFRLLCGRAPLAATPNQSPLEKLQLLARHQAPRLDTLRPDAPAELVDLVAELLAREPQDRPASAAHVAERLSGLADSADLGGLLAKAQAAAQADAGRSHSEEAVGDRLRPIHARAAAAHGSSGGRRSRSWWIAFAAIPLLVLAGVLIVLETQKGQLVVESEVADVRVKVLKDGQPVRDLEIRPGATSSRLRADQYEIVIDSPSDSLRIDKSHVLLRSGETVVARIYERPATAASDAAGVLRDATSATTVPKDEPLYDGQPLRQWLETLRRDRSPESIGQAFLAIRAMLSPTTADRITRALVSTMPALDGDWKISISPSSITHVDAVGFGILEEANPGPAFFELLVRELERSDPAWSKRILIDVAYRSQIYSFEEVERLVDWLEKNVFADSSEAVISPAVVEAAYRVIFRLLHDLHAQETAELRQASTDRLLIILENSPRVSPELWLAQPTSEKWPMELRRAVVGQAAKALADLETPPAMVAQAAMILTREPQLAMEMAPDLPPILNIRLAELAEDRERLLAIFSVTSSFVQQSVPETATIMLVVSDYQAAHASEALEILDLAKVLPASVHLKTGVEAVVEATSEANETVSQRIQKLATSLPSNSSSGFVDLKWPSLRLGGAAFDDPRSLRGQTCFAIPGLDQAVRELADLSPEDWMAYLIHTSASAVAIADRRVDDLLNAGMDSERADENHAPLKSAHIGLEIRRAEREPAEGLTEATVAGTDDRVYLYAMAEATNDDIAGVRIAKDSQGNPAVEIIFTAEGAKKMEELSAQHKDKPLAILIDGKVITAPRVTETFSQWIRMTGRFTQEDVEKMVERIGN